MVHTSETTPACGMVMLQKLGMDPSRLMRSIEKLTLYNRQVFQTAMDESGYPTLDERRKFADAVRRWLAKRKAGGSHALDGSMEGTPRKTSMNATGHAEPDLVRGINLNMATISRRPCAACI